MPMRAVRGVLVAVAAGGLVLTACSSNKESGGGPTVTGSPTVTQNTALVSLLPSKIKSAGKLIVGVNVPYTPNEFKDFERQDRRL